MNKKWIVTPYVLWIIGFTVLPLAFIAYYGLTNADGQFTLENIAAILEPIHLKAMGWSLILAVISTVGCLLLAYPLAFILSQSHYSKNSMIVFAFILPMWMNFVLRTMAVQMILSNNGIINTVLRMLCLPELQIMNTNIAIVIGMIYDYLPFMVLPLYNSLSRIDKDVVNAAHDLGAGGFTTFRKIIFPLSLPGVISGITMVFIPAISEFVIANLLGGGKTLLIGNVIEQEFMKGNNWNLGSGLSLVLMVFIMLSMAFMNKYDKDGEGAVLM